MTDLIQWMTLYGFDFDLYFQSIQAATSAIVTIAFVWLACNRSQYVMRDFIVIVLLLLSMLIRFFIPLPPASHLPGITVLNLIFVLVSAIIVGTPTRLPTIRLHRRDICKPIVDLCLRVKLLFRKS